MTQINIIGGIVDSSGYSVHTRNLANALSKITEVKLSTQIPPGGERLINDKELDMIKKPSKDEINLIITMPLYWRMYTTAKRNWVFLVWEGNKIPKSYLKECMNEDIEYIFVPSEHTKKAIYNTAKEGHPLEPLSDSGIKTWNDKIKIIPHGVDLSLFYPKDKPKDKFRFLINKGFRNLEDRGGAQYGLQAYMEEFKNTDNVELIFKINPAYGIPDLNKILSEISPKGRNDLPLLKISADNLPYDKMVNVYNQCHCLVAPTRSDAFNIPCIEAMACGLPVITTNFGGQTDFCNEETGWIIGGEMTEVKHEINYEGISWLTPSIPELRKAMREAYFNWEKESNQKKIDKCIETSKQWTWDETAKKVVELI